ncbi:unnamed protein product [Paramecium pentaurelia]|uniref:Uncharacterized protein n=1 Tax=Paramecium pentaurelia TaxID=43138 RepID=A0A8S1W978_9CILI|nr:unnamed protein product [Paramecium pentaurelia]
MLNLQQQYEQNTLSQLTTNSSKIFDYPSVYNRNEKIRKYCHQLVDLNPKQFKKYFISEQYIDELLNRMDYEKLLKFH